MFLHRDAPMASLTRRRILQVVGGATCLLSAPSTVFFILYAVSTSSNHSPTSAASIIAAVLDICSSVLILIFTIFPNHPSRIYPALASLPSIVGGILSAVTLGWLNLRISDLPSTMLGHPVGSMVVAGFALFVVSLVSQTVFWTALIFQVRETDTKDEDHEMQATPPRQQVDGVSYPSPAFSMSKASLVSSVRDSKRLSYIFPPKSTTKSRGSVITHATEFTSPSAIAAPAVERNERHSMPLEPEVNHFDTWETSDVSIRERVAASLAVVEQETLEEAARGLGISTPEWRSSDELPRHSRHEYGLAEPVVEEVERQSSPMLPESDATPRSINFPMPAMTGVIGGGHQRSGSNPGPAAVHGGTGRWPLRSQTP